MKCPECGHNQTEVRETRSAQVDGFPVPCRTRRCLDCGHTFKTLEIPKEWVKVEKNK